MLVQLSIYPMDRTHISKDIGEVAEMLANMGIEHQIGPVGTSIKGDCKELFTALEKCHNAIAGKHKRVVTTIVIDDDREDEHSLRGAVRSAEEARPN